MTEAVFMSPSILSADFTRLGEAVALVEDAGADFIHVDVMDGHFVPNLTVGPPVVRALKSVARVPLDVHLMIDDADRTVAWYLDAGADMVTVHVEACDDLPGVVRTIRAAGAKAGVSIKPATPVEALADVVREVDLILVMSVEPGFGGQVFIGSSVERIAGVRRLCERASVSPLIEVDGGIDERSAPLVVAEGARSLVAGNAVFGSDDPPGALRRIREAAAAAL